MKYIFRSKKIVYYSCKGVGIEFLAVPSSNPDQRSRGNQKDALQFARPERVPALKTHGSH